jgi:hypothetical protein
VTQDKGDLLLYLNGEVDTCDQIDIDKLKKQNEDDTAAKAASESYDAGLLMSYEEMEKHRLQFSKYINKRKQYPILQVHFLLIYIYNFHVFSHFLLIYICKLHWNFQAATPTLPSENGSLTTEFIAADQHRLKKLCGIEDILPGRTRNSVLSRPNHEKDFKFALDLFNEHVLKFQASKDHRKHANPSKSASVSHNKGIKLAAKGPAIIIVPNSLSGVLSRLLSSDLHM